MWILILTLITTGSHEGSAAMISVPGFSSYEQCNAAAQLWIQDTRRVHYDSYVDLNKYAICAKAGSQEKK